VKAFYFGAEISMTLTRLDQSVVTHDDNDEEEDRRMNGI
jgi:hypothetical protein